MFDCVICVRGVFGRKKELFHRDEVKASKRCSVWKGGKMFDVKASKRFTFRKGRKEVFCKGINEIGKLEK